MNLSPSPSLSPSFSPSFLKDYVWFHLCLAKGNVNESSRIDSIADSVYLSSSQFENKPLLFFQVFICRREKKREMCHVFCFYTNIFIISPLMAAIYIFYRKEISVLFVIHWIVYSFCLLNSNEFWNTISSCFCFSNSHVQ